jgi:hypothetical protein
MIDLGCQNIEVDTTEEQMQRGTYLTNEQYLENFNPSADM